MMLTTMTAIITAPKIPPTMPPIIAPMLPSPLAGEVIVGLATLLELVTGSIDASLKHKIIKKGREILQIFTHTYNGS